MERLLRVYQKLALCLQILTVPNGPRSGPLCQNLHGGGTNKSSSGMGLSIYRRVVSQQSSFYECLLAR